MKLMLFAILFVTSIASSMACIGPGLSRIELNDDKVLLSYGLLDVSDKKVYYWRDDLADVPFAAYYVANSTGKRTHYIELEDIKTHAEVTVYPMPEDIDDDEFYIPMFGGKKYKGAYSVMRGCNEIVEIE